MDDSDTEDDYQELMSLSPLTQSQQVENEERGLPALSNVDMKPAEPREDASESENVKMQSADETEASASPVLRPDSTPPLTQPTPMSPVLVILRPDKDATRGMEHIGAEAEEVETDFTKFQREAMQLDRPSIKALTSVTVTREQARGQAACNEPQCLLLLSFAFVDDDDHAVSTEWLLRMVDAGQLRRASNGHLYHTTSRRHVSALTLSRTQSPQTPPRARARSAADGGEVVLSDELSRLKLWGSARKYGTPRLPFSNQRAASVD